MQKSNGPPQRFVKFLDDGRIIRERCYKKHPSLCILFDHLTILMREDNLFRASIDEIATMRGMTYDATSVAMRQLCDHELVARTGMRHRWMVNPFIACKCTQSVLEEVQFQWCAFTMKLDEAE